MAADGSIVIDTKIDGSGFDRGLARLKTAGIAGATAVGVAVGAALGYTLKSGLDRALDIEDAKATLKSLGYSIEEVGAITETTLSAVKGTPFALNDAMAASVNALASGVKEADLEAYLKTIGDAATVAKVPFSDMAGVFDKVTATGKVTGDVLNELGGRGIPILQWLADEYGVTADEMREMVSRGEVDAAAFQAAIESNVAGAALDAGETTRGAFDNMKAAVARLGEGIVADALPQVRDAIGGLTALLDGDPAGAEVFAENFEGAMMSIVEGITKVLPTIVDGLASVIVALAKAVPELLPPLLDAVISALLTIGEALPEIIPSLVEALGQMIVSLAEAIPEFIPIIIDAFMALFEAVVDQLPVIAGPLQDAFVETVTAMVGAFKKHGIVLMIAAVVPLLSVISRVRAAIQGMQAALVVFQGTRIGGVIASGLETIAIKAMIATESITLMGVAMKVAQGGLVAAAGVVGFAFGNLAIDALGLRDDLEDLGATLGENIELYDEGAGATEETIAKWKEWGIELDENNVITEEGNRQLRERNGLTAEGTWSTSAYADEVRALTDAQLAQDNAELALKQAKLALLDAQDRLSEMTADGTHTAREMEKAQLAVEGAELRVEGASVRVTDAVEESNAKLDELPKPDDGKFQSWVDYYLALGKSAQEAARGAEHAIRALGEWADAESVIAHRGGGSWRPPEHGTGGYFDKRHLAWIGDKPEYIFPAGDTTMARRLLPSFFASMPREFISSLIGSMSSSAASEMTRFQGAVPRSAAQPQATPETSVQNIYFQREVRTYSEVLRAQRDIEKGLVW